MKKHRAAAVLAVLLAGVLSIACSGCSKFTFEFERQDKIRTTSALSGEILGTVDRVKPAIMENPNNLVYPKPNAPITGANATEEKKELILQENQDAMAACEASIAAGTLKKHSAADGLYEGTLADSAQAVIKKITMNGDKTDRDSRKSLGLFAPAGEVVTVSIPADQVAVGYKILVGYWDASTNVPASRISNRMPILFKTFQLDKTEVKVGTPFGGPIYFEMKGKAVFDVIVTGAVEAPGYTYGATTNAEWQRVRNAPGLFAEMRTEKLRFLVPSAAVRNIDDPSGIMEFYDKAYAVSSQFSNHNVCITMSFDYYVAAGAAVAFVGAWFCELPMSWAYSSMNLESMQKSGGWGTLHEMNHHFQATYGAGGRWGIDDPGEVTNNVANAATYILYTNIAAYRTEKGGLSGWNYVADPYTNLKGFLDQTAAADEQGTAFNFGASQQLPVYAAVMHSFGVDKMAQIARSYYGEMGHIQDPDNLGRNQASRDDFAVRSSKILGVDMTYFCDSVFRMGLSETAKQKVAEMKLPKFEPIANLYTMGADGVSTGRPFYIPAGAPYVFDFAGKMASQEKDFTFEVKGFKYGKLKNLGDGRYEYTPPKNPAKQDAFSLEVKTASGYRVTLTGKIAQDPNTVTGARYDGITESDLDSAVAANHESGKGASIVNNGAGVPVYNSNAGGKTVKSLAVIEGKIIPAVTGEYKIYLKADDQAKLMFSTTGKAADAKEVARVSQYIANYSETDERTFFTTTLTAGQSYYFKIYNYNMGGQGFAQIGWKEPVYDHSGPIEGGTGGTVTKPADKISDIPNSMIFALNAAGDAPKKSDFYAPYYFERTLTAETRVLLDKKAMSVVSVPTGVAGSLPGNLIDGNTGTYYHTQWQGNNIPAFPHDYVLDLGGEKTFNFVDAATWRSDRDPIGEYEILAGDKLDKMKTIASGKSSGGRIAATFPSVAARYVTVRGLNNIIGNKYTVVSEIDVGTRLVKADFYAQTAHGASYSGFWEVDRAGSFANGAAFKGTGSMEFTFTGTGFGYYAKKSAEYGTAMISVDGGKWQEVNLTSEAPQYQKLVYAVTDLKPGEHTVRIKPKSGQINVDFFGVVEGAGKAGLGLWWIAIGAGIAGVAGAAAYAIIVAIKHYKPAG